MRRFALLFMALAATFAAKAQTIADFESFTLSKQDTFYFNTNNAGSDVGFDNGLAHFQLFTAFGFWDHGFSYSNMTDSVTSGYLNQYSAKAAKGHNSAKYAVAYGAATAFGTNPGVALKGTAKGKFVKGFYVTNSTYAYNDMRDGSPGVSKKFGGPTGNDPDWFKLVVRGYKNGILKADSVEFYLADFRSSNNANDYILRDWKWVNLMPLGNADSLDFALSSSDNGQFGMNTPAYFCMDDFTTYETSAGPFAPQVSITGSDAINKNDAQIIAWAKTCTVNRGYMDIANTSLGKVTAGDDTMGVGMADNSTVSLGDSGVATLTFANPVFDAAGPDFAVFENGFVNPTNPEEAFLEYAFVEVSSDGQNFFRFPATCLLDTAQIPAAGVYSNARKINNLAGKYTAGYGTPFDLHELAGTTGLDITHITHIRLIDVVGSIDAHGSRDMNGVKVNDPYPTALAGGGFDLDAVGVMHTTSGVDDVWANANVKIYPNPATDRVMIDIAQSDVNVTLTDVAGKMLSQRSLALGHNELNVSSYKAGVYFLAFTDANGKKWIEKITKL